jgi:hypothetical protein
MLLSCGWRRFSTLVALLLGRRSLWICFLVDALPKPKIDSHAAPPIYEMASQCSHNLNRAQTGGARQANCLFEIGVTQDSSVSLSVID